MDFDDPNMNFDPNFVPPSKGKTALYNTIGYGHSMIPLLESQGKYFSSGHVAVSSLEDFISTSITPTWKGAKSVLMNIRWPFKCSSSTTPRSFLQQYDEFVANSKQVPIRRTRKLTRLVKSTDKRRYNINVYSTLPFDISVTYNAESSIHGVSSDHSEAIDCIADIADIPFGNMDKFEASDFLSRLVRHLIDAEVYTYDVHVEAGTSLFAHYPSHKVDFEREILHAQTLPLSRLEPSSAGSFICKPDEVSRYLILYPLATLLVSKNDVRDSWMQPFFLEEGAYVSSRENDTRSIPTRVRADYGLWRTGYEIFEYSSYVFIVPIMRSGSAFATKMLQNMHPQGKVMKDLQYFRGTFAHGTQVTTPASLPEYREWRFSMRHAASTVFSLSRDFFPTRHVGVLIAGEYIHFDPMVMLVRYLRSTKVYINIALQVHGILHKHEKFTTETANKVKDNIVKDFLAMLPTSFFKP